MLIAFAIAAVVVALAVLRCRGTKPSEGRAVDARIEQREGRDVLLLVDEVCDGGGSRRDPRADCEQRVLTVAVPQGVRLDASVDRGTTATKSLICPERMALGDEGSLVFGRGDPIEVRRSSPERGDVWSVSIAGRCQLARILGDTLVIASSAPSQRAVGIDLDTGRVRWRVHP